MKLLDGSQSGSKVQASVSKSAATGATTNHAAVAQVNTSGAVTALDDGKSTTYSVTMLDKNNNATTTSVTVSYDKEQRPLRTKMEMKLDQLHRKLQLLLKQLKQLLRRYLIHHLVINLI